MGKTDSAVSTLDLTAPTVDSNIDHTVYAVDLTVFAVSYTTSYSKVAKKTFISHFDQFFSSKSPL